MGQEPLHFTRENCLLGFVVAYFLSSFILIVISARCFHPSGLMLLDVRRSVFCLKRWAWLMLHLAKLDHKIWIVGTWADISLLLSWLHIRSIKTWLHGAELLLLSNDFILLLLKCAVLVLSEVVARTWCSSWYSRLVHQLRLTVSLAQQCRWLPFLEWVDRRRCKDLVQRQRWHLDLTLVLLYRSFQAFLFFLLVEIDVVVGKLRYFFGREVGTMGVFSVCIHFHVDWQTRNVISDHWINRVET